MAFLDETGLAELWSLTEAKRNGLVGEYVWAKKRYTPATTNLVDVSSKAIVCPDYQFGSKYSTSIIVSAAGVVTLSGSISESGQMGLANVKNTLLGKYFIPSHATPSAIYSELTKGVVYYCPANAAFRTEGNLIYASPLYQVNGVAEINEVVGYVNSPDPNAYPINDGYTYVPMGMLGEKARIETGSYVGTGGSGSSNKTSLSFSFEPKFVVVSGDGGYAVYPASTSYGWAVGVIWQIGATKSLVNGTAVYFTPSGNTLAWYSNDNVAYQQNASGQIYHYIAIG